MKTHSHTQTHIFMADQCVCVRRKSATTLTTISILQPAKKREKINHINCSSNLFLHQ